MTQYLLSVWHDDDFTPPDPVDHEQAIAQVGAFNTELQTAGASSPTDATRPSAPSPACDTRTSHRSGALQQRTASGPTTTRARTTAETRRFRSVSIGYATTHN